MEEDFFLVFFSGKKEVIFLGSWLDYSFQFKQLRKLFIKLTKIEKTIKEGSCL